MYKLQNKKNTSDIFYLYDILMYKWCHLLQCTQ
jgi:hypothetical protein